MRTHESAAAELVRLTRATAAAMKRATVALEEADVALADDIVADSVRLDREREELARRVPTVLAPAVPVLAAIHALTELERLSGFALQVARAVQRAYPHPVVPHALTPAFVELGRLAVWLVELAADGEHARASIGVDDDLADLRGILATLREPADIAALSRVYERFAEHAVVLGRLMKSAAPGSRVTAA
ncbi:phosphate transport system regulatory protein PhoU [Amycolatopsis sp., V23-08]|uniref:Phosphate transport system regulatory protein PhoU n=1 Tax=Amycolatopsis heterodermiae TaxID=3110235 RepID=A0ABU5RGU1_9PSEU|nr:PhoU domain-containing protein [Amycolatopsis sp., V23-08]MEA5365388.1 phosphate transport system regulatory protein PhoU [Amycolatopsis sp., V23-08]